MDIRIKTTDYQMVPEASAYVDGRIAMIEKSLTANDGAARIEVEVGRATGHKSGDVYFAEVNLVSDAGSLRATAQGETINAAIDQVKDDIVNQLRRRKQLHRRVLRKGGNVLKNLLRFGREE